MKIRAGQIWKDINSNRIIVRKGSKKDYVTFTYLNSSRGHNLYKRVFYEKYEFTGDCIIGKQFKKNREQY